MGLRAVFNFIIRLINQNLISRRYSGLCQQELQEKIRFITYIIEEIIEKCLGMTKKIMIFYMD
ncbi:MAG: hypothetical protein US29_C0038G0002 [candidate division WS6 bacterium GW2011_GWF1_36_8]|uniref:Uncharacterized protein n=1 Tax=candidate division WS6 bacterium GW2011_GWF1_36_8 TaxID=1619098 RepID=A0A0G0F995_9BACT|nr:MAG: hypothetical protein US29_C0038G0002 [candidate division WS6 bacterium GW2011_GWF1_36_8]